MYLESCWRDEQRWCKDRRRLSYSKRRMVVCFRYWEWRAKDICFVDLYRNRRTDKQLLVLSNCLLSKLKHIGSYTDTGFVYLTCTFWHGVGIYTIYGLWCGRPQFLEWHLHLWTLNFSVLTVTGQSKCLFLQNVSTLYVLLSSFQFSQFVFGFQFGDRTFKLKLLLHDPLLSNGG